MIRDVMIPAKQCTCDRCGYSWLSQASTLPESCRNPQCRSRQWNGAKRKSRKNEIRLPSPRKNGRPKTITLLDPDTQEQV